jgi:molybdate transport system regulatory protein
MPVLGPLKLKAQLLCGEALAMGPGKADLLEAIGREGSISGAGRALGMSYRRTWLLVDTMNRCWAEPLVEAVAGGGKAKGARLTPTGRQVLATYRALEARLAEAATAGPMVTLARLLRDAPRPAGAKTGPDPGGRGEPDDASGLP